MKRGGWALPENTEKENLYSLQRKFLTAVIFRNFGDMRNVLKGCFDVRFGENIALIIACENGDADIAELLLACGADPRARNNEPLRTAFQKKNRKIIDLLVKAGADPGILIP